MENSFIAPAVIHSISTSNHNSYSLYEISIFAVIHSISTSNHNTLNPLDCMLML